MKFRSLLTLFLISILMFTLAACAGKSMTESQTKEMAQATQRMGEEQYRSGKFTAALKNLLEAEKSMPDDPYLHNSLGLVYLAKERPEIAEKHFKKALALKPDYAQAQNNLGGTYMALKKWNLAIQVFKQVSENLLYATPEMPLSNLGWAYFYQNMYNQASAYFDKALDIRPDFINAVHGHASIYLKQQNYETALDYLQKKLNKNPGTPILHADLAKVYEALNEFTKARSSWNVVLQLVPERSPLAKEAMVHIQNLK